MRNVFVSVDLFNMTAAASYSQMSQTVGVVCIGLVGSHIEGGLCMARVYTDRRQTLRHKRMVKPNRQRSGLKYHALCIRPAFADHFGKQFGIGGALAAPNALAILTNRYRSVF
mgnify:CR=1 FL=1